ncbi:putative transposable element [Trichonephila clavipes]|nr:putative transposable element [Trichonephila clavipes]
MLWERQVAGRNYPPTNKNTLIRALTEEWDKLPEQLLYNNVAQSMVRRVECCITLHGGHIPDEAHFWLNGYVNKQTASIWVKQSTSVCRETPLHPEKLIVWCALWAGGIIGPYFFKTMKATTLQSMVIGIEP